MCHATVDWCSSVLESYGTKVKSRPFSFCHFLHVPLNVDLDVIDPHFSVNLGLELLVEALTVIVLALLREVFPLDTFLNLTEIRRQKIDAKIFKLGCVVRMGNEEKIQDILRFDELSEYVLADLT